MQKKFIRAFNFDLDTNSLKKYYPTKNYRQAYKDIEKILLNKGFVHKQWSGYKSINPLSDHQVIKIVRLLNKNLPWFSKCINNFDVTNVQNLYDLTDMIKSQSKVNIKGLKNLNNLTQNQNKKNLQSLLQNATKIVDEHNKTIKRNKNKVNNLDL